MSTLKPTAFGLGTLLVLGCGAALALEVPRSQPENESVPQPPMMRAQSARLPERQTFALNLRGTPAPSRTTFQDLDLNGDGSISRLEAGNDLSDFALWDRNGDGRLSRLEFDRYLSERATLARGSAERQSDRF